MGNISILLADDSITIQKVVGIIFAGDGYTLTVVDNGAAAVQKAQEILPDVLLIDVLMPGMNGYEVCEQLRTIPALAAKPILLLTGSFEAFDEAKAKSCGADDYITKPFESQQIIAKVKELYAVGQRRAAGAPPAAVPEPEAFVAPVPVEPESFIEPAPAATSPDDPWGAFTQQPTAAPAFDPDTLEVDLDQPDVMAMIAEEPQSPVVQGFSDANIGASWVPVEEQTFEFQEEIAEPPASVLEPEPPVVVAEEPPMPAVASFAAAVAPPAAAAAALTEAQLKEALMSVSKETIERIVWEVVPDLAESLIKETIRRITEGK